MGLGRGSRWSTRGGAGGRPARRLTALAGLGAAALAASGLAGCSAGSASGAAGAPAASCATLARGARLVSAEPDRALDREWSGYLASNTGWTGGDSVYTYPLGAQGTLYTFADSFIRGLDGLSHRRKLIYHNLFVVSSASGFRLVTGGTPADPAPLIAASDGKYFYLALGGEVDGSTFQAIFMERLQTGPGSLDNVAVGSVVATFSLPGLQLLHQTATPGGSGAIQWGSYVHRFGADTYIYGATAANGLGKRAYVARVAGDDLLQPWSYWDGSGWTDDAARAAPMAPEVQPEYGVAQVDGIYVLVTSDPLLPFSPDADVWYGCSPTGPWLSRSTLTLSPLVGQVGASTWGDSSVYVYDAMVQPALDPAGGSTLVVSFDRNSLDLPAVMRDADIYMPSYLDLSFDVGKGG